MDRKIKFTVWEVETSAIRMPTSQNGERGSTHKSRICSEGLYKLLLFVKCLYWPSLQPVIQARKKGGLDPHVIINY